MPPPKFLNHMNEIAKQEISFIMNYNFGKLESRLESRFWLGFQPRPHVVENKRDPNCNT